MTVASAPLLAPTPHIVTELPGPEARRVIERDERWSSPSLTRVYPLVARRGSGCVIEDVDGNRFLDFNAGIAVTAAGHAHPEVNAAVHAQVDDLLHYCSSDFYLPAHADLVERLAALAPMDRARVFLANSGTEAVEGALKLARHVTGRPHVIGFLGAFHGRSLGSLSLTASRATYRSTFGVVALGTYHAPFAGQGVPDGARYIEEVIFAHLTEPSEVAAVFVEPIQGEGGYLVPPDGWLTELRRLCDRHDILLVADEVQSGVGRTGDLWAVDHEGVRPDILLSGKGLASGLPLSAIIARDDLMTWGPGRHGSTFGGNPVGCAAALATLDLVERELAENAREVGAHLLDGLRRLADDQPLVVEVRGRGLMIGIELPDGETATALERECFRRGLLVLTCGPRAVRLAPPLVVSRDQADTALAIIADACAALAARPHDRS